MINGQVGLTKQQRADWAAALRSGKYKQISNRLADVRFGDRTIKKATGFCCLGVLQLVCGSGNYVYPDNEDVGLLTHKQSLSFISMNDKKMLSFAQIADEVDKLPTID